MFSRDLECRKLSTFRSRQTRDSPTSFKMKTTGTLSYLLCKLRAHGAKVHFILREKREMFVILLKCVCTWAGCAVSCGRNVCICICTSMRFWLAGFYITVQCMWRHAAAVERVWCVCQFWLTHPLQGDFLLLKGQTRTNSLKMYVPAIMGCQNDSVCSHMFTYCFLFLLFIVRVYWG